MELSQELWGGGGPVKAPLVAFRQTIAKRDYSLRHVWHSAGNSPAKGGFSCNLMSGGGGIFTKIFTSNSSPLNARGKQQVVYVHTDAHFIIRSLCGTSWDWRNSWRSKNHGRFWETVDLLLG